MREFQRRVRIALEENHMLPGDPNRVFNSFVDRVTGVHPVPPTAAGGSSAHTPQPQRAVDPTTIKPQDSNPFSGS
jgi:small conductance mechanosensitive channel